MDADETTDAVAGTVRTRKAAEPLRLNEETVKALAAPESGNRITYFGPEAAPLQGVRPPRGFGVRVTSSGARSFVLNYRIGGRERRLTIGQFPDWSAIKAVKHARELRQAIDRGEDPLGERQAAAKALTVAEVLDRFVEDYCRHDKQLRGADEIERTFARLVKPQIGSIGIRDLRRSQVSTMLDDIARCRIKGPDGESYGGLVMADRVLAYFRKAMRWWALKDDDFVVPIVPGMAKTSSKERARQRVLTDEEIKTIWSALERFGTFGAIAKGLLLTAQRRDEVAGMLRAEIGPDGVWELPPARMKAKQPHAVPLTAEVRAIIDAQPRRNSIDLVFPSRTGAPFSAFGRVKNNFDAAVPLPHWTLHDLRRTARSIMSREGVRPDIAERVLGHAIKGVEGVYDRHAYLAEKRDALERLAAAIVRIVS